MRAISATGGFRVPLALFILVLDGFRVAGDFLFLGGRPRSSERLGMGREGFRKCAVDSIGPAAIVLDNPTRGTFRVRRGEILSHLKSSGEPANLFATRCLADPGSDTGDPAVICFK